MSKNVPQQNLMELLEKFQFSAKEAEVYITLLEMGPAQAHDIAKRTSIHGTTLYVILEALLANGFVSKYKNASSRYYFNALDPKKFV
ncbi:hypothetical protein HYV71_01815 [Candidatus Uhrbacteria bacterium]|nr:hypothetical protein [Candidatus Uhrbacteria bacterium]